MSYRMLCGLPAQTPTATARVRERGKQEVGVSARLHAKQCCALSSNRQASVREEPPLAHIYSSEAFPDDTPAVICLRSQGSC